MDELYSLAFDLCFAQGVASSWACGFNKSLRMCCWMADTVMREFRRL